MHVPAWPVLPDQTIARPISEAFRVPAMAGLGAMVCDDSGCYDDGSGAQVTEVLPTVEIPTTPIAAGTSYYDTLGFNTPPGGTVTVPASGGGNVTLQNRGTQASPVWAQVTQGIIDVTKLMTIQPGTVQQGGTTLRQTPGYAVPTPATSTQLQAQVNSGAGLAIAAAVGLAALIFLSGRK